jgi:KRAB domain-containing zinc finger protein
MRKSDCPYCKFMFLTRGDLERHLGMRDFTCDLCHETFTLQQTLNGHMNRHYGLKPYECKVCGKAFSEMSTVYEHKLTHVQKNKKLKVECLEKQVIVHELPSSMDFKILDPPP